MKPKIIAPIVILVFLAGAFVFYLNFSSLTFSIEPNLVEQGSQFTVSYRAFWMKDFRACEMSRVVESITNAAGQEMLIRESSLYTRARVKSLTEVQQMSGFIRADTYADVAAGKFIVEPPGCPIALQNADPSFMDQIRQAVTRTTTQGTAQQLVVLPGTPAGVYHAHIRNQIFSIRVE